MTTTEWGRSFIVSGVLLIITAAVLYAVWPDWMAARVITSRLTFGLTMGLAGMFMSMLGAYMVAGNAR